MMDFGLLLVLIGTTAAHFGGGFAGAQQSQGFGQPSTQIGYLRQGPPPSSYGPIQSAQQSGVTGVMQALYNPQQAPAPTYQLVPAAQPSTGYVIQPMGVPQPPAAPMAPPQPAPSSYSQGPYPPSAMPPNAQSQPVFPPAPPPAASFTQDNSIGANIGHPDGHSIPARRFRLYAIPNF